MHTQLRIAAWYAALMPVLVLATLAVGGAAIEAVNRLPRPVWESDIVGVLINVVPPVLCGLVAYGLAAIGFIRRDRVVPGAIAHAARASVLYMALALCITWFASGWGTRDFGLWAQIPAWIGLACFGGVLGDAFVTWRARPPVIARPA